MPGNRKRKGYKKCFGGWGSRNVLEYAKSHKKSIFIFVLFLFLAAAMGVKGQLEAGESAGTALRQEEGRSSQAQTFAYRIDGGEEQKLTLDISSVERTQEEALELLETAASQWEDIYLGGNTSADEVRQDLNLPASLCDGLVKISYESSDYSILDTEGRISTDSLPDEGALVELTVTFSYGDYERIEVYGLYVQTPEEQSMEWLRMRLLEAVQNAEESSRTQSYFALPDSVAGHAVTWEREKDSQWIVMIFLGIAAVFCLEWRQREAAKKQKKERSRQLMLEYPQMVEQMSLLLESGMTIRGAWERMLQTDQRMNGTARNKNPLENGRDERRALWGRRESGIEESGNAWQSQTVQRPDPADRRGDRRRLRPDQSRRRIFIEEMWITYREIREGRGERECYERFGARIGLMPYRRFGSLLSQNLSKGGRDIRQILRKEAADALEMRKNQARKMGEEAGTKMIFPMFVMLVLILLALLLPAAGLNVS